jgi:hypothetical protein
MLSSNFGAEALRNDQPVYGSIVRPLIELADLESLPSMKWLRPLFQPSLVL